MTSTASSALAPTRLPCVMLTQSVPATSGHGASIRAGLTLEALAQRYAVTLVIATQNPRTTADALSPAMASLCAEILFVRNPEAAPGRSQWREPRMLSSWDRDALRSALAALRDRRFDTVHVFRLRLLPVWRTLRDDLGVAAGRVVLDLDDIESRSLWREVRQAGLSLGRLGVVREALEALRLRRAENRAAREVDRMLVCSEADRAVLQRRVAAHRLGVLPNGARFGPPLPRRPADREVHLLLLGSLDYAPNQEAARWLIADAMPVIRARVEGPVRLDIVGRRPPPWLVGLAATAGERLHADVPSVEPFYADADVVLAPIRTGGGTRIKIIEAFGHGRPVVSTHIGAEGLGTTDGRELVYAETAAEFADAVARLAAEPALCDRVTRAARALVEERYSGGAFARRLLAFHAPE